MQPELSNSYVLCEIGYLLPSPKGWAASIAELPIDVS